MVLSESGRKFLIYSGFLLFVYTLISLVSLPLSFFFGFLLTLMYGVLNIVCLNQAFNDIARDIFNITSANDTWQNWLFWWFVTLIVFSFVFISMFVKLNEKENKKKRITSS